jgi:hypothetical protein
MQIKNMRLFRQQYKKALQNNTYDENYVGAYSNEHDKFGYFSLIHGGAKGGEFNHDFGNFLQAFLEMASDGQAVYEFLQNAVDVQSSQFFIRWGQLQGYDDNYVLVMNNGRPFSEKDIKSILNIGMSTKAYVNKGEQHTIGKFGIGFKLAHRLVGESNGLNELVNKYQGPILFSWHNNEWKTLAGDEPLTLLPLGDPAQDESPWFFKILMTCFPCLPGETVLDVDMNQRELFGSKEVQMLRTYLKQYRDDIGNDFGEGSMFFIRLGRDKEKMLLADSLDTGVRFSTAILNRVSANQTIMKRVVMNQHIVTPPDLQYWSLTIEKEGTDKADFNYILYGDADHYGADTSRHQSIQLLMGYANYQQAYDVFRDIPNLYLFFPLSEEKHAFNFIIHSNAFYMAASRTKLHDGTNEGGINHRLFEVFVRRLSEDLQSRFASEDAEQQISLLTIYPNLLLADPINNIERSWVNNALITPIHQYLTSHIPVYGDDIPNRVCDGGTSVNVKILSTRLPLINTRFLPSNVQWFYWSPAFANGDERLCDRATTQLGLTKWTVESLLGQFNLDVLSFGKWLTEDDSRVKIFLKEIDSLLQGTYRQLDKNVEARFAAIKLFAFTQDQETHHFSLNDLNTEAIWHNCLIRFANMTPLEPHLTDSSVGFALSDLTLADYPNIYSYLKTRQNLVRYLGDFALLNRILSDRLKNNTFSGEIKADVLKSIEQLTDLTGDARDRRIEFIELYTNQLLGAQPKPFKQLLSPKLEVPQWLKRLEVNEREYREYPEMERYTTRSVSQVYESVILLGWDSITQTRPEDSAAIYKDTINYYVQAPGRPQTLTDKAYVISEGQWIALSVDVHVHYMLGSINTGQYNFLRRAMQIVFGLRIPDKDSLSYLDQAPFQTSNQTLKPAEPLIRAVLATNELTSLLTYCQSINYPFFEHFVVSPSNEEDQYKISSSALVGSQYHHSNQAVQEFVASTMLGQYSLLPIALAPFRAMVQLRDDGFLQEIINEVDFADEVLKTNLCRIVGQTANPDTRKVLLDKIGPIILRLDATYGRDTFVVQVLNLWGASPKTDHASARQQIRIADNQFEETLDVVTLRGANQLQINGQELPISDILMGGQSQQFTEWVSQLLEQFSPLVDQLEGLRSLLNLDQTPDVGQVYEELINTLQSKNYILKKAAQIAFIFLYKQSRPNIDTGKWYISDGNGNLRKLEGLWYISETPCAFIPKSQRLAKHYDGLAALLSINSKQPERKAGSITLRAEPTLESNATLNLTLSGSQSLSNDHQLELLTWYYESWRRMDNPLQCQPQNTTLDTLLSFDPRNLILEDSYACQAINSKERVPLHVVDWMNKPVEADMPARSAFLRVLGAHRETSPVVQARKFMVGLAEQNLNQSPNLNSLQAYYTLVWLEEQEVIIRADDNARRNLLNSYYFQSAEFAIQDIPLPQLNPETNTWELCRYENKPAFLLTAAVRQMLNVHPGALLALTRHFVGGIIEDGMLTEAHQQQLRSIVETTWLISAITTSFVPDPTVELKEYDRIFYQRWREKHDKPIYSITDGIPIQLEVLGEPFFQYRDTTTHAIHETGEKLFVPASWSDENIIKLAETLWGDVGTALRQEYQQFNQYILDLFSQPNADNLIGEEIRKLQIKIEQQQQLEEAKQIVNNPDSRYTLAWFRALIELEQSLSNRVNMMNEREGNIDFGLVETMPFEQNQEQILLRLSHPSRTFSQNIESYGNFVATVEMSRNGRRQSKRLVIKGVSKKGQTLLALVNQNEFLEFNGAAIHRLALTFSQQINFLATLDNNYGRMELTDDYNFKSELTTNIQFVFGPPGTGKTTHLSRFILERMSQQPQAQMLVLTPTNKAADVLAARILKEKGNLDNPEVWLARYGTTADQNLIEEGYFYDSNSWAYHPNAGAVLITTIHRFLYEQVTWGDSSILLNEITWRTIIVDEASMIALSYLNFVLHKRKYNTPTETLTEFVIGGDPFQLPPVVDIPNEAEIDGSIKEENIYSMVGLLTFDPDRQAKIERYGDRITNLNIQYRSIRNIGELFSHFQYDGRLNHHRATEASRLLPKEWSPLAIQPITCLRFTCNSDDTIYRPQRLRQSPYQLYSAQLLVETLRWMSERLPETEPAWSVGVVTPYRAQAQLVNKLLETVPLPVNMTIVADTVHGFQGDECDIVFVLLNPPNYTISNHSGAFINKTHLVNVAISRARDYLVLVYPDDRTSGIHNLKLINKLSAGSVESIIQSLPLRLDDITLHTSAIEHILFGSDNYLQHNTFTNSHQMVNVYGRSTLHFTVRSDENALDIQVRLKE